MLYDIICTSITTNSIKSLDKVKLYIYIIVYIIIIIIYIYHTYLLFPSVFFLIHFCWLAEPCSGVCGLLTPHHLTTSEPQVSLGVKAPKMNTLISMNYYIVYQFLWYNFIELYIYSSIVIKLIMHNCIIYISFNL